jgi:hypothetical protein
LLALLSFGKERCWMGPRHNEKSNRQSGQGLMKKPNKAENKYILIVIGLLSVLYRELACEGYSMNALSTQMM